MKKHLSFVFLFVTTFILLANISVAATSVPPGNVSGTWTLSGSPYNIQGNIQIADAATLIIQPGVTVNFQGTYKLNVQGRLVAIGTATDSIIFTAANTTNGWRAICFDNTPATNDSSKIIYCKLLYGKATGSYNHGGGLYFNFFSKAVISKCRISLCDAPYGNGGGIYCISSNPIFSYNTISFNISGSGAGIYCNSSNPVIINNFISNNTTNNGPGGAICCHLSNPLISNNTISYNSTPGNSVGAGIVCESSSPSITNNTISYNTASSNGGGIYCSNSSNAVITNNIILNNAASNEGGGVYCIGCSPSISNNNISNNTSGHSGGGISCVGGSANISNNIISNNSASDNGGGIYSNGDNTVISNNTISNNVASTSGGGIFCNNGSTSLIISNNTISNNTAQNGGGIDCSSSSPTITNNSITFNAASYAGALYCENTNSNPIVRNCILWGNTANTSGSQVALIGGASNPNFYYCDVQGGTAAFELNGSTYTGTFQNNVDANPLFVSPSGGSGTGFNGVAADWSLQSNSPCINTGDPVGTYPATDKAANARVTVCRIDMGAYEYQNGTPFSATIAQTQQILCYGDHTAKAIITPTGGSPTYTYLWSNGQTNATATGLGAGTYTVTVTETSFGCSLTKTITIYQPAALSILPSITNPICTNNNGIAGVTPNGGTSPYSYLWSTNNNNTNNTITGLLAGTYSVTVTDNNNCAISDSYTLVTQSPSLSLLPSLTNPNCTNNNGAVGVTPSGGTAPYSYLWSINNNNTSNTITDLLAGTYSVTVTDINGCTISNSYTLTTHFYSITLISSVTNAHCNTNDGSAGISPYGGTAPYSYHWSNNSTTQNLSGIGSGTYSVTVTDHNGCTNSETLINHSIIPDSTIICMVTVDSLSKYNVIVWEKPISSHIDSFLIYRDIANNNFALIGKVPYDSLSQFTDTVRTLYSANGDPNASTWKYKIAIKDSCGNISSMSPFHKTLFIQNNGGNFSWNDYLIEGQVVPIPALSNYLFQRDNLSNGNWITIQTLSASSLSYTDIAYSTYQNTATWRVRTVWSISCTPRRAQITSISNIKRPPGTTVGMKQRTITDEQLITIAPNPAQNKLLACYPQSITIIEIYNGIGQLMIKQDATESLKQTLDISSFKTGLYQIKFIGDKGCVNKKFVKTD